MQLATDKMIARKDGAIGWMIFNNPARRNAVSLEMWSAIATILEAYAGDDEVRVVVMAGAADKAFVSGADISQFEEKRANAEAAAAYAAASAAGRERLSGLEKPLIAMIRGYCIGGGLAIALAADIRIAAEDAQFGVPAARLGIAYGTDAIGRLRELIGPSATLDLLISARRFDAAEALHVGLVNRVVPVEALEAETRDYALGVAGNAPLSVRAAKLTMGELMRPPEARDEALLRRLVQDCFDSADYAEGRRAFMEKRKPVFRGA